MEKYSWHQSHDQATVLVLLNGSLDTTENDVNVTIDSQHLVVQIGSQPPTVKGRLYGDVNPTSSTWHLEHTRSHRRGHRTRQRTASSTSSTSSFALLSDPGSTSSAAVSPPSEPENAREFNSPDFNSPSYSSPNDSNDDEEPIPYINTTIRRRHLAAPGIATPSSTGGVTSLASSFDSTSLASYPPSPRSRLLTIHLDKKDPAIWPSLIVGGVPTQIHPAFILPPDSLEPQDEAEVEKYNMDATSLSLVGVDLLVLREDRHQAFEYLLRAWLQAQIPLATLKLVTTYIPLQTPLPLPPARSASAWTPATSAYYVRRLGGIPGVARLYLDAGLLYLDGAASFLISSTSSGLSSLRTQGPFLEYGPDGATGDKDTAMRYFERARSLDPELQLPTHQPLLEGTELQMPSMTIQSASAETMSTVSGTSLRTRSDQPLPPPGPRHGTRVRSPETRASQRRSKRFAEEEEDQMSHLYLPGLLGAGTALLAVGLVGVMSVSWWRKGQN